MAFLVGLDKHVRVMEGGRESNDPQKLSGWSCALNRASRLQKTSTHHPLMVHLQHFSINGLEESGHHSPLHESNVHQGGRGLEEVSLGKEGGPGHKKGEAKIDIILWNS